MASRRGLAPVPNRKATEDLSGRENKRTRTKRRRNAKLWAEAMELAATYDIAVVKGNSIVDVLQTILDRVMDKWRFVCMKVDRLSEEEWLVSRVDDNGNELVEPNIWLQYEGALRAELMDLALRMGHLGVDERKVRVQEAQVELLGRAMLAAAHQIGLDADTQRALGSALREQLKMLEGGSPAPATVSTGDDRSPAINSTATDLPPI